MKKTLFSRVSRAAIPNRKYRVMRDPNGHEIDITADLTDGSDGALGDVVTPNAAGDTQMQAPPGTQPVHGDAKQSNQQQPTDKAELGLREQLSSAFKGNDEKPTDQQQAQTADNKNTQQAPVVQLTQDSAGKWHTPDGAFASAEQVQAFQAAQNAPPADSNAQQSQSPVLEGLTPVERQQLQSLPAELRQYVERTMEDLNTRGQKYSEYDMLEQIIGPRRQAWAQQGSNPVVAMNQLFALSDFASRDPGGFVMYFAKQQNLDLDALLDAQDAAARSAANLPPEVLQMQQTVHQLAGTVQQLQQQPIQQAQQQNIQLVEQFAMEKDPATGNLKRPYLTDVIDEWTAQIPVIRATNPNMSNAEVLEKAYDAACWANPSVRTKLQQAAEAQRVASENARVQQARAAGASVTGAPAGEQRANVPGNSNLSLRDELQQQFALHA